LEIHDFNVFGISSQDELHILEKIKDISLFLVSSHISFVSLENLFDIIENKYSATHPVMFIDSSKEHDTKSLNECYKFGCVDYIKKPFDSKEIMYRINFQVNQFLKLNEYRLRLDKLTQTNYLSFPLRCIYKLF